MIGNMSDFIVWYVKNKIQRVKVRALHSIVKKV